MCGRMTLTEPDLDEVAADLEASVRPDDRALYRPRYNVAPTDQHWVALLDSGARLLVPARWAFGAGDGKPPIINARSEGAIRRGAFARAFAGQRCGRCVVPADGFFEWTGPKNDRRPIWFHKKDGGLLYLAGLFEPGPNGTTLFTVLTTEPNALVAPVHDRMPVLLAREAVPEWLAKPASELLVPAPDALLVAQPVSTKVNSVKNDDASVLDAPTPALGPPQGSLF